MAVDLVLRLCQVDEDDGGMIGASWDGPVLEARHIQLNDFVDGLYDLIGDDSGAYHNLNQFMTFYDMPAGGGGQADQQGSMNTLFNKIIATADLAGRMARVHRFRSVMTKFFAADSVPGLASYNTPDDVQTWLLALDSPGQVTPS